MGRLLWHTMMSLDGFIAGPNDDMRGLFGVGGGDAGLLDEIVVHVAPILLGGGVGFYSDSDEAPVRLYPVSSRVEGEMTVLRYSVTS